MQDYKSIFHLTSYIRTVATGGIERLERVPSNAGGRIRDITLLRSTFEQTPMLADQAPIQRDRRRLEVPKLLHELAKHLSQMRLSVRI